jgi:hypothetical protein
MTINKRNRITEVAQHYLKLGLNIIPVGDNKTPLVPWKEYQNRMATPEEVQTWFSRWPDANIGIVTGKVSGIVVVDLDSPEAVQWAREKGLFENTPVVQTKKGLHVYYAYPGYEIRNSVNVAGRRIDIRADGGYVVAPPSQVNGHIYTWLQEFDRSKLVPFPQILHENVFGSSEPLTGIKKLRDLYPGVPAGERNSSLARLTGSWLADGLTYEECLEMALLWNQRNNPPMDEEEVKRTVKSIYRTYLRNRKHHVLALFDKNLMYSVPLFVYDRNLKGKPQALRIYLSDNEEAIIHPSGQYGLPSDFDEAVFLAICRKVFETPKSARTPLAIGSFRKLAEILQLPQKGETIDKLKDSIRRLVLTGIESRGVIYDKQVRRYVEGVFHVFDMAVFIGETLPDGTRAENNYVWINALVLNNIDTHYGVLVDFETYINLPAGITRGIYRVITPLLKSRKNQKDSQLNITYTTLQTRLHLAKFSSLSKIKEQLQKPLENLAGRNIIKNFQINQVGTEFIISLTV